METIWPNQRNSLRKREAGVAEVADELLTLSSLVSTISILAFFVSARLFGFRESCFLSFWSLLLSGMEGGFGVFEPRGLRGCGGIRARAWAVGSSSTSSSGSGGGGPLVGALT